MGRQTKGKKKSKGSRALMVGVALYPGRAVSETGLKATELLICRMLVPPDKDVCGTKHTMMSNEPISGETLTRIKAVLEMVQKRRKTGSCVGCVVEDGPLPGWFQQTLNFSHEGWM